MTAGLPCTRASVHLRFPAFRYCRNPDCAKFFDYELERRIIAQDGDGRTAMRFRPKLPMRKRWLAMPSPANQRS